MRINLVVVIATLLISPALGQTTYPIRINHTGDDSVGTVLAYQLREQLATSKTLHPADSDEYPRININIVTMNPDKSSSNRTIHSTVLTIDTKKEESEKYYQHWVGVCGTDRVKDCATTLIANAQSTILK